MIKQTLKNFWVFGVVITGTFSYLYLLGWYLGLEVGLELSIITLILNLMFLKASHTEAIRQMTPLNGIHALINQ